MNATVRKINAFDARHAVARNASWGDVARELNRVARRRSNTGRKLTAFDARHAVARNASWGDVARELNLIAGC